ncbi:MAG: DUF951 domain-containing protein [Chloroflexota bacterium]
MGAPIAGTPTPAPRYNPSQVMEFRVDDVLRLRKPHPCGSYDWQVYRLGADIGMRCLGCGHRVLIPRSTLERRLRGFLARGPQA